MKAVVSVSKVIPWIISPIVLQALFKTRGGYYYRTVVSMLCLSVSACYGVIASIILPIFGKRHLINWTVSRVYKTIFSSMLGITCTIEGKEHIRKDGGQAIYICNHQSILDIFFMANVFPKSTSVVAKKSIKFVPVLGWFMYLSKAVFLDRTNRETAVKNARKAAADMKKNKTSIWVYPEGTRANTPELNLLPFKKGAFYMAAQANVPIIPIVVQNYNHLYDQKSKRFGHGNIKIKVLPPISTEDVQETSEGIDKLSSDVRSKMLNALRNM
ncbi:hypothetical protein G6F57_000509 [Rhizopus arrhizus]|uniref:1-acyl-sn-glycerol-3-phosphate acyltransferase n=1 Tax=Rhizopus oryzae TaxID=64495 RepID=A0A9P7BS54_RHIOR|nr:hypothetical protein G6F24_004217 [Rhizopus arrhizus]KAG1425725.1 hypothetical protein G6F58_001803 [Rhizopus delemar]KAG0773277.1 hypothetical protein G6F22_015011 [Rhizopus arrhizus]KAG0794982.1 hypothetical protein G6F21_002456 [Rhizopus arrhizus]KAG0820274.1 hypothetical protein G6F20_000062 [Rhizopus arrhizus]